MDIGELPHPVCTNCHPPYSRMASRNGDCGPEAAQIIYSVIFLYQSSHNHPSVFVELIGHNHPSRAQFANHSSRLFAVPRPTRNWLQMRPRLPLGWISALLIASSTRYSLWARRR